MGLLLLLVARDVGARVIVSEPHEGRRAKAQALGAAVIDPEREPLTDAVRGLNDGNLADVTILTIGVPALVQQAMETVRPSGRLVLFGGFSRPATVEIDPNIIHYREISIIGSEWIGVPPYANVALFRQAVNLIAAGRIRVDGLITGTYSLAQIGEAFEDAGRLDRLKSIVFP